MPAFTCALATCLVVAPALQAQADNDPWVPTTWTGVVAGAPVLGNGLPPAPTPSPLTPMAPGIDPVVTYEPQTTCDPSPKPGATRISDIIKSTYGARQITWIPRGCGVGPTSEHKEGRAIDWMVSVRDPQQRANAEAFLNWLLGPDESGRLYGHALQLGVMYIGWHDRIWRGFSVERGWQELKGCFSKADSRYDNYCHRNHIHISLTRQGASGMDPTGVPITTDYPTPPPPEAPLDDSVGDTVTESAPTEAAVNAPAEAAAAAIEPPAPVQDRSDSDLFTAVGSQLGYSTNEQEPLRSGEKRTIQLRSIPDNATSALVSVTTRDTTADGSLRVGLFGKKRNAALLRVPKGQRRTSVMSIPVSGGSVQIRANETPMNVRIDVLGYAVDGGVYPAVGSVATTVSNGRFSRGEVVAVNVRGIGVVPRQKGKVTAVILRVTAEGMGEAGRFSAYPLGGTDLATSSAVIPYSGRRTSVLVADVGRGGAVALASSTRAKVKVEVVGYVQR